MSHNIYKIFYINLNKRVDRKEQIEEELKNYGLIDNSERFEAIETKGFGILGCTQSHLATYKLAKERGYKNVLIFEDDFYFVISKEELEEQLERLFTEKPDFDVVMLSYLAEKMEPCETHDFLEKTISAQTASGYIVNEKMYDKMIELYEHAAPLLESTREHWNYANDQIWKKLQPTNEWYCFTKRCGKQRDGYSDNSETFRSYDC